MHYDYEDYDFILAWVLWINWERKMRSYEDNPYHAYKD